MLMNITIYVILSPWGLNYNKGRYQHGYQKEDTEDEEDSVTIVRIMNTSVNKHKAECDPPLLIVTNNI